MSSPETPHLSVTDYLETGILVARVSRLVQGQSVRFRRTGYSRGHIDGRGCAMDDQTQGTLADEDITTVLPVGGVATKVETDPDATDADGTDGDATDGTDGDSSDADGTDGTDADGTDGDTTDGTDGDSSATS
jgi:hypothetical protein